jgi:hypothetical protein
MRAVWFLIRVIAIDQLSEPIDQSSIAITNHNRSSDIETQQVGSYITRI